MFSITCIIALSASFLTLHADDDLNQEKKTITEAIRHLDDEQLPEEADIEPLWRDIDASSPLHDVAIQTASFLYVKRQEYLKAWKLLSRESTTLDDKPLSLQLGHDRLMLWLAMESGQTEKGTELLKKLVKQLLTNDELSSNEKRILADFLGKFCGMAVMDSHPDSIPNEVVLRAIDLIEGHESKIVSDEFRKYFAEIQALAKELAEIKKEVTKQQESDATLDLERAKTDLQSSKAEFEQAHEKWDGERKELRRLHEEADKQEKNARRIWHLLTTTEEPGRPREPREPKEPKRPQGSRNDKDNRSDWDKYNRQMSEYRRDYQEYSSARQTFAARLAEWQARNEKRKERLTAEHAQATNQHQQAKAKEDAQRLVFKQIDESKSKEASELERANRKARFLEASIQAKSQSDKKSVHRPSLFPILDFPAEMERLIANTRNATTGP
jgi:hypothetical protein